MGRLVGASDMIIVLPFANQTGDEQKGYVADALTETVTTDLSRLSGAYVVPTATAFAFRDRKLSVQQVSEIPEHLRPPRALHGDRFARSIQRG